MNKNSCTITFNLYIFVMLTKLKRVRINKRFYTRKVIKTEELEYNMGHSSAFRLG